MKTLTGSCTGDVLKFSDEVLKTWLAVAVVCMAIQQIELACVAMAIMAIRATFKGRQFVYLGLSCEDVEQSRIIKYGLPMAMTLSGLLLLQTLFMYQ